MSAKPPPLDSVHTAPEPHPTIIRDIRLHHAIGGHVRFCDACSDPDHLRRTAGKYVLDVVGHDAAGVFNKHKLFDSAPTAAQVIEAIQRIGEW